MEDSGIVRLLFARDQQAIAELSQKYGALCLWLARNILKNDADAEECVNDALLAAWNTIPPQNPDPLKTYLLRLVRNISVTRYHANTCVRRNSYYDVALDELSECLASTETVEQQVQAAELSRHIERFLDTLDRDGRVLFVRRYWFSDSIGDLAARFGMSRHRVSVRLFRIRENLKAYLGREGVDL